MAYKFQIGRARLSGSVIAEEGVLTDDGADITSDNDIRANNDIEAGAQLRAIGDLYIASTSMQVGNAEFGGTVAVTGAVSAAELSGALEYKLGAGAGISMADWRNGANGTIAVDETWLSGTIQGYLSMEADRFITYDGAGNFAMDEVLFSGSSRGLLSVDLSSNGGRGSLSYNASNGVFSYEGVTQAEIRGDISVTDAGGDGSLTYNSTTGVITYTGPSAAEVRAHLSVADSDAIDLDFRSGAISAELVLSGGVNNDALEIVSGAGLDLKSTIAGSRTFSDDITINGDLIVLGNTFSASVGTLLVEDALITVADGAASLANGQGFEIGANLASFKVDTAVAFDGAAEAAFDSSLPIQAPHMKAATFHGELVGTMKMDVVSKADADTVLDAGKVNKYENLTAGDADSIALPSGAAAGQMVYLKMGDVPDGAYLEVTATDIDGVASIYLESPNAAVTFICNGSNNWMVF
jgi:hypothetical protein